MGEKALVEGQISDSIELVKKLDEKNASPTFAAWNFYPDIETWRLLIAGPVFDALVDKQEAAAYGVIIDTMMKIPHSSMSISDIKLVRSGSQFARAVAAIIGTAPDALSRDHFTDNYINGVFIKEMFVLRSVADVAVPA